VKLTLSFACDWYDRTEAIRSGEVAPQGIELIPLTMTPAETFWRLTQSHEFDVSEMSLSGFIMRTARGDDRYVGLPAFTSRVFRHDGIILRSEISSPEELSGRRVAVPEYHMTAALFMRGLLADEFGVDHREITWVQAGHHTPGRIERERLSIPEVTIEVQRGRTIDEMLRDGSVSASLNPYGSTLLDDSSGVVRRLYDDPLAAEAEYYGRTGIYPIMHMIVVKRSIYERHPWVARNLYDAFVASKDIALQRMNGIGGHSPVALPGFLHRLEQARAVYGDDLWPYGIEANRVTLEAACRYSFEQGLSARLVSPDELFAETLAVPAAID
jgi:4,5-dihydroxyphthalate decarboxylase